MNEGNEQAMTEENEMAENAPPFSQQDVLPSKLPQNEHSINVQKTYVLWLSLALFLITVVGGIGAFNYWIKTQYEPGLAGRFDGLQIQVDGVRTEISRVAADAAVVAVGLAGAKEEVVALERRQQELQRAHEKLRNREVRGNDTLILREVEYLLIIANQRLLLASDVAGASAALGVADERLRELGDPRLIQVRAAITEERKALDAVKHVDINGQARDLAKILGRVADLPLKETGVVLLEVQTEGEAQTSSGWRGVLQSMWNDVLQIVDVKQTNVGDALLFDPDARQLLYQSLRLELASARFAVVNRDTENMQASVAIAQGWLESYFRTDDKAVENIIETLNRMQTVELAPMLPRVDGSLKGLRAVIAAESDGAG